MKGLFPREYSSVQYEINLVNQTCNNDCVAACISMALGIPIEEIKDGAKMIGLGFPMTPFDATKLLCYFGVLGVRQQSDTLYSGNLYKIGVPSKNTQGGLHSILIDLRNGRNYVFDPQQGVEGKKFYGVIPKQYFSPIQIIDLKYGDE